MAQTAGKRQFKGLLLSWLVSYAFILVISFAFILTGYIILSRNVRDELFRAHRANVQQSQLSMDYLINEVMLITNDVILLPEIQSLGGFEGELGSRQYYLKNRLYVELGKLHSSHPAIETVYVFFKPANYIVSSMGAYEVDYYFDTRYAQSALSQDDWVDGLFAPGFHLETTSYFQSREGDASAPHLQFITNDLPMFDQMNPSVSICITVRESTLKSLIGGPNRDSLIYIVDDSNEVYLTDGGEFAANGLDYSALREMSGQSIVVDERILTSLSSKRIDWQFVSLSLQSEVEGRLNRLRWIFFGAMLFFWVVGSLTAYLFARRNYRPVTRLMDYVSGKLVSDDVTHFRRVEYRYIEESFNRLNEEKASIQDLLTLQQESVKSNFISRLLLDKLNETTHSIEEQCELLDLYFEEDAFLVVVLRMEETVLDEAQLNVEASATWLSSQIHLVIAEHSHGDGWVCDINGQYVIFLNLQEPSDDPQLILHEMLSSLSNHLRSDTGITYTIGASRYTSTIGEAPLAYQEASIALDYRIVRGKGAVISYYDVLDQEQGHGMLNTLNWERRFINLFSSGSYLEAGDLMQSVLQDLEGVSSLAKLKIRLFGVINLLLDAMGDFIDEVFLSELESEPRLLACTTVDETRNEVRAIFHQIKDYTFDRKKSELLDRVTEIIQKNYADQNFSVGYIADQLELSISNFSWLYKEETGMGPLEAIHRTRLQSAKTLLGEKGLTIRDIAGRCGYLSDIAFIRVFKKYEGVTPGQYRNQDKSVLV